MDKIRIIFEDQNLIVINKPAGLVVNRALTHKSATVQDWLLEYLGEAVFTQENIKHQRAQWAHLVPYNFQADFGSPEEIWLARQGLVHRLDKETSGALLLAKNPGALVNLLAQFKEQQVNKEYLALCHGHFALNQGKISVPLARARNDRLRFALSATGRVAETHYQVIERYDEFSWDTLQSQLRDTLQSQLGTDDSSPSSKNLHKLLKRGPQLYQGGFSLVKAQPKTGRTHQIRVHFASMHHPLIADKIYSGRKRQALDQLWCPRHFLHAASLKFFSPTGPVWEKRQSVEVPLTADLQKALNLLQ